MTAAPPTRCQPATADRRKQLLTAAGILVAFIVAWLICFNYGGWAPDVMP